MASATLPWLLVIFLVAGCLNNPAPTVPDEPEPVDVTQLQTLVHGVDGELLGDAAWGDDVPKMGQHYVAARGSGEPTIALTPKGTAIYPSIEFDVAGTLARTELYRSRDQGKTWDEVTPQIALQDMPPTSLDPFVFSDHKTGRVFSGDLYVGCSYLSFSDDEGETWTTNPIACGVPVNDHQSFGVGPATKVQTMGYPNLVYYCINQLHGAVCSRSLDGGMTFLPTSGSITPACSALTGHIHASWKDGTVYLPYGCGGEAHVMISHDNGDTWKDVTVDAENGFVGHDGSVATDSAGTAYYFFLGEDTFPRLAVSRDQGETWEPSMNVSAPGVTAAKFPAIVAGDDGRVAFLYIGSTVEDGWEANASQLKTATWNAYVGFSRNASSPAPIFATVTANPLEDPLRRGACGGRCNGMFDFMDIDINPTTGQVWVALVDLCNDKCADPAGKSTDPITSRGAVGVQSGGMLLRVQNATAPAP